MEERELKEYDFNGEAVSLRTLGCQVYRATLCLLCM